MDKLSALDAEFLHLEDGSVHMAIAGACVFADPPPAVAALEALVASKLHLIPRYRQRVRTVPFELGRPVWVDDPDFDLGYHVRHTALPHPATTPPSAGSWAGSCPRTWTGTGRCGRRGWWRASPAGGGHWSSRCTTAWSTASPASGLLTALLDLDPDAPVGTPEPWAPAPEPRGAQGRSTRGAAWPADLVARARDRARLGTHPVPRPALAGGDGRGTVRFTERLAPTRPALHRGPDRSPPGVGPRLGRAGDAVKDIRPPSGGPSTTWCSPPCPAATGPAPRAGRRPRRRRGRSLVPVSTRARGRAGSARQPRLGPAHRPPRPPGRPGRAPRGGPDPDVRPQDVPDRRGRQMMASASDLVPPMVLGAFSRTTSAPCAASVSSRSTRSPPTSRARRSPSTASGTSWRSTARSSPSATGSGSARHPVLQRPALLRHHRRLPDHPGRRGAGRGHGGGRGRAPRAGPRVARATTGRPDPDPAPGRRAGPAPYGASTGSGAGKLQGPSRISGRGRYMRAT